MEASSHALEQHRVDGVVYDAVAFTNLSQDHLDYHASMERYFAAKAVLFAPRRARRGRQRGRPVGPSVADLARDPDVDVRGRRRRRPPGLRRRGRPRRGSRSGSTVSPCGPRCAARSTSRIAWPRSRWRGAVDLADEAIVAGIADVGEVPGRVEPIDEGQEFLVVVDYAHTPDSILGVLQATRPLATGRLIVVFGCGGDRDRAKRPLMGEGGHLDRRPDDHHDGQPALGGSARDHGGDRSWGGRRGR